ncbi:MAG: nitroreductase family protein [Dehalococcoidia bacterium]|nr:nitroreductase family protein [Dehalococcoidia bacterium]
MEIMEAIRTRRSIRSYKTEPVKEESINSVLDAARWAPSWANTQCREFIVVKEGETRRRLAETLPLWNSARLAIAQAPVLIVACARLGRSGFIDGELNTDKGDWYMFDVALAMQNLTLAAHALGLGTVHVGAFDAREAARILQVPAGVVVVEMTPLGYPAEDGRTPHREPLSEMVFHETYGQK